MGAELLLAVDGHTDRHDEASSYFSEFCERTYKLTRRQGKIQFAAVVNGFNSCY
jgi:hypothetical protein